MMRYKDAGVSFDAAHRAKSKIKKLARQTFTPRVLGDVGAFGGFYALKGLPRDSVLVASVDGVGTKLKLAFELNHHSTVGADLVNHCVNDIAVHGAEPLFFLDYLAVGRMHPAVVEEIVGGIARACRENGCALIGGETAEMPGFYPEKEYDLAGCIVGCVRRAKIVDGSRIRPGDYILGLPSLGLHTNGYSLARKVLLEEEGMHLNKRVPELGRTLGEELLAPHRSYQPVVGPLLKKGWLNGLVHVTGGGISDNTPRILPTGCRAEIAPGSWPVPPIFNLIRRCGKVPEDEMLRTFNCGLGMLLIVPPARLRQVAAGLKRQRESFWRVGRIVRGKPSVKYVRECSL
ncbi:MAG TPA: phosphoribosylformylglycinamidine cyclo-ligase [Terriglobia bacterium]|nr:phosphoribosylformylglycinamidine cyclo-ligase [Terriglobia bacterium]